MIKPPFIEGAFFMAAFSGFLPVNKICSALLFSLFLQQLK
jgi:hypothetical protein